MNSWFLPDDSRSDPRLEELFLRYWDDKLHADELAELEARLTANPQEQDSFNQLCLQAAMVVDHLATNHVDMIPRMEHRPRRSWRRTALMTLMTSAALVVAALAGLYLSRPAAVTPSDDRTATLISATGSLRIEGLASGMTRTPGALIKPGGMVATEGIHSSGLLLYPDGTTVTLTGDTEVVLSDAPGKRLYVQRGNLTASVRPQQPDAPMTIVTPEAQVEVVGTVLSVKRSPLRTEVGVKEGQARISGPQGAPPLEVSGGERSVVEADGTVLKDRLYRTPDSYRWHTDRPLPPEWEVGCILDDPTAGPSGRVIAPVLFDDPFIHRRCWQIRSENGWISGLFLVHADSRFRLRYRVDRPGEGQLLMVVRPDWANTKHRHTHVLVAPIAFEPAPDGGWHTVTLSTNDWYPEKKLPNYPLPWVAFLLVFNTYENDLGLRVAEFAVNRAEAPLTEP